MAQLIAGGSNVGADADQFGQGEEENGDQVHGEGVEGEEEEGDEEVRMAAGRQVTEGGLGPTRRTCCCASPGWP